MATLTYIEKYNFVLQEYSVLVLKELINLLKSHSRSDIIPSLDNDIQIRRFKSGDTFFIDYNTAISENYNDLWLYKRIFLLIPTVEKKMFISVLNKNLFGTWRTKFSIIWEKEHAEIFKTIKITDSINLLDIFAILSDKVRKNKIIKKKDMRTLLRNKGYYFLR